MKNILLTCIAGAMLISCGKKSSSTQKPDLGDADGDQIYNFMEPSEFDKYVSNFEQVSAKTATFTARFKTKSGDIKILESKIEIGKDVREELTKVAYQNFHAPFIHLNSEYFSEFTTIKIHPFNKLLDKNELTNSKGELEIIFDNEKMHNDHIGFYKKENGNFIEIASGRVTGNTLIISNIESTTIDNQLINATDLYLINNSHMGNRSKFFNENIGEVLRHKTYRFIVSTPDSTNIYYVSNHLTIAQFLQMSGINISNFHYRETKEYISLYEDQNEFNDNKILVPMNFLSNFLETKAQNGLTYALYAGSVKDIKDEYLKSLKTVTGGQQRHHYGPMELVIQKNSTKELILDFDMQQVIYPIEIKDLRFSARSTSTRWRGHCYVKAKVLTSATNTNANIKSLMELGLSFTLDGKSVIPSADFNYVKDGKVIRRFIFKQLGTQLKAHLRAAVPQEIGYLNNECIGRNVNDSNYRGPDYKLTEEFNEVSFSVNYQAYIE